MKRKSRKISRIVFTLLGLLGYSGLAPAQAATFTDISAGFDPVHHGTSTWVDYDNDGDLDVFLNGQTSNNTFITRLYRNNGGTFALVSGTGLPDLGQTNGTTRSAWGDFDNDGYIDVLMIGTTPSPFVATTGLYRNNSGNGTFTQVTVAPSPLAAVTRGAVAWGDYDNDGDLDVLLTGLQSSVSGVATVYRNGGPDTVGGWIFVDTGTSPPLNHLGKVWESEGSWGDYDRDGDLDLVVIGSEFSTGLARTRVYRNDGGLLVNANVISILDFTRGYAAWGDYDDDGYLDLAVMGSAGAPIFQSKLIVYHNNQDGTFTQTSTSFPAGFLNHGSLAWGDGNNDGHLDLLVTGSYLLTTPVTRLLYGDGSGAFTQDPSSGLMNLGEGQAVWGDYDNDGRLDILLSGTTSPAGTVHTKIYKNNTTTANTAPTRPLLLSSEGETATTISLRWVQGSDAQTPADALSYNLSLKETVSGKVIMFPMADAASGYRRLPQIGNANQQLEWSIGGLQPLTSYEACVQTIDQGLMSSNFRCRTVTTTNDEPEIMIADCQADVGTEPNLPGTCVPYWNSESIWVRNADDNGTSRQSIITGQDNFVYVKLKNIGFETLPEGVVHVYFAKGNTSSAWPTHWVGSYNNTSTLHGDYIGQARIESVFPFDEVVAKVKWESDRIPSPDDFNDGDAHHFCLLARFVAVSDPMAFPEGPLTLDNTMNNNNIAWVNLALVYPGEPKGGGGGRFGRVPIEVGNPAKADRSTRFQFEAGIAEDGGEETILNHAEIKVTLPAVLYNRWMENGGEGDGITTRDDSERSFFITSPKAVIRGLSFNAEEQLTVDVEVTYLKDEIKDDPRVFLWHMVQYEEDSELPIGGETLMIHMSEPKQDSAPVEPAGGL